MPRLILGLILSYLIGAIPFAFVLGKVFKSTDIRKHGSGNIGATNAFRVLGPFWGVIALALDIAKGLICPTVISDYLSAGNFSWGLIFRTILGITAVIGHNWTVFLKFRGGKGVATSLGVILGLAVLVPQLRVVLLITLLGWLVIFLASGFVSLASIISALLFPVLIYFFKSPRELLVLSTILSLCIIFRHKPNILRLLSGRENRFYPLKFLIKIFRRK